MLFGWLFFVLSILPVALIAPRLGYVLYVPLLGLAAWIAGAIQWSLQGRRSYAAAFAVAIAIIWFHARNWTPFPEPDSNPEARLTRQFRAEYPKMKAYTKLLFASDDFPAPAYDLRFNLELLYGVPLEVKRLHAPPDQQPVAGRPLEFEYVFAAEDGHYVELANRDLPESIRLHTLRNYTVGRHMSIMSRDHGAYVVSGVLDGEMGNPGRWTKDKATLKFDLYPADSVFSLRYFVADPVVAQKETLTISINGNPAGVISLDTAGLKDSTFAVPAKWITRNGFTLVDLTVSNPFRDAGGNLLGVVLSSAGFEYRTAPGAK
jgi:hypothetical protein